MAANPLEGLKADDLRVDAAGRPVIVNPDIVERLRALGPLKPDPFGPLADNGICCGNGSCLSDQLLGMMDRLTGGRRALG